MPELKQIHIKVPKEIYEDFYRIFPGRGERTKFLLDKICEAITRDKQTKELPSGEHRRENETRKM